MSYDITLTNPVTREPLLLDNPHQMRGGTYAVGGTQEATLNVTYNYSALFSFHALHGMSGADSIPLLETRIATLGEDVVEDYWQPTEGNVKCALIQLATLAKLRPDGVWEVI